MAFRERVTASVSFLLTNHRRPPDRERLEACKEVASLPVQFIPDCAVWEHVSAPSEWQAQKEATFEYLMYSKGVSVRYAWEKSGREGDFIQNFRKHIVH